MIKAKVVSLHSVLIWMFLVSLFSDLLEINLGFTINIHHLIVLLYIPFLFKIFLKNKGLRNFLRPLILEWKYLFFLAIFFGILFPWEYKDEMRTFSQKSFGRAWISVARILIELLILIVPFLWIKYGILTIRRLFKIISYVVIFSVGLAVIDYFLGYTIKGFIPGARIIEGRFTGLNGEPRAFGRSMLFASILLYYAKENFTHKLFSIAFITALIGIAISFSASTIFTFLFVVVPVIFYFRTAQKNKFIIFLLVGISLVLIQNLKGLVDILHNYDPNVSKKIELVLTSEQKGDAFQENLGPSAFKRFEVFDRAALYFLWDNPIFFIFGTGPNLISIPSSKYLDDYNRVIYGEVINSVPHSFLINVLSRSGLMGLTAIFFFFFSVKKQLKQNNTSLKLLFVTTFVANLVISSVFFYFIIGVVILIYLTNSQNDIDNYPHIKFSRVY